METSLADLCYNEKFFSFNFSRFHILFQNFSNHILILVEKSRVNVSVSNRKCIVDCCFHFITDRLKKKFLVLFLGNIILRGKFFTCHVPNPTRGIGNPLFKIIFSDLAMLYFWKYFQSVDALKMNQEASTQVLFIIFPRT